MITLRRGALYEPIPADWLERADPGGLRVPILGIHGSDDPISPLGQVRDRYAAAPSAELVSITAGRHDVLNDQTPNGDRHHHAVPGTDPAGRWPAPDCGLGAAGMMMNGPGAAVEATEYGGMGPGSLPRSVPARVQPELPGARLCIPEPGRSVLHMC
jgi:hypothetical protein